MHWANNSQQHRYSFVWAYNVIPNLCRLRIYNAIPNSCSIDPRETTTRKFVRSRRRGRINQEIIVFYYNRLLWFWQSVDAIATTKMYLIFLSCCSTEAKHIVHRAIAHQIFVIQLLWYSISNLDASRKMPRLSLVMYMRYCSCFSLESYVVQYYLVASIDRGTVV